MKKKTLKEEVAKVGSADHMNAGAVGALNVGL